ncbi:UBX domain-containing protein 8 isoform X2 [Brienomyrus brachyistius]|uniref:UBX domain-containing protein 8 isoform X2 n=1 Tax=Brienomyrus brachyistius TaxID=42636 RepID=UPI0020B32C5C|nr:UBX domain-containing protein 8 isoform X2 [Brienomyrus brachyistius]
MSVIFSYEVHLATPDNDFIGHLLLMGRGLFLLVLYSWILSLLRPLYTRLRSFFPSSPTPQARSEYEDVSQNRELARIDQQERHSETASTYQESVLKPRKEARLRKKQRYRMTVEAWKLTRGQPLGVVVLPDEPPENAEGVVRVVLRCPGGEKIQRKFFKSHSSRVLLDWMLKSGFPPHIYAICTSYPQRPLRMEKDLSLEDAGIETDTVLNVEEMEIPQSETQHLSD